MDPRDRAYDCKERGAIVKRTIQTRLRASKLIHLKHSLRLLSCCGTGLEPAIQRLTMEVTEAAESTSEKEEEQELLRLRNKLSWLHLSSYTIFLFARFD